MSVRLLIADDAVAITDALVHALPSADERITIVGRTAIADEVVSLFEKTKPEVVLLDLRFGRGTYDAGLYITSKLLERDRDARIIIFSQFETPEIMREAYRIGAACFLPKSTALLNVVEAIFHVNTGKKYFTPSVAEQIARASLEDNKDVSSISNLTSREMTVFKLLAEGRTNSEIATELGLSAKTISFIAQDVKGKLGTQNSAKLTLLAVKHSLIIP